MYINDKFGMGENGKLMNPVRDMYIHILMWVSKHVNMNNDMSMNNMNKPCVYINAFVNLVVIN